MFCPPPVAVTFRSHIELTLHNAFLPAAGVLLCDPVATVHLLTLKTLANANPCSSGGVSVTVSAREVGRSSPRYFTAHPTFEETITFDTDGHAVLTSLAGTAPSLSPAPQHDGERETIEDYVVITVHDAAGTRFFGEAYAPFSPHCTSAALPSAPVRVQLRPRNAHCRSDPLFLKDMEELRSSKLDDFGFVSISWRVAVLPRGGALMRIKAPGDTAAPLPAANTVSFPLGLTLRATWLAPEELNQRGAKFTTSVGFSGTDRFIFEEDYRNVDGSGGRPSRPLFLTIRSAAQLQSATFHCCVQNIVHPEQSGDVAIALPLPDMQSVEALQALDRDVHWASPVRSPQGRDFGLLLVCLRVSRRPLEAQAPPCPVANCPKINDPLHQEEAAHTAQDFGRGNQLPDCPLSAYQRLVWESPEHVARATERRWKVSCLREAKPTIQHVRHVFDVLMQRAQLDMDVARVVGAYFNKVAQELTAAHLKEFMVAAAFHAHIPSGEPFTVLDAARFCFVALRRDVADAISAEEVFYLLEHALLPKMVEMPAGEVQRWVKDIIGDTPVITYAMFTQFFLHNYAMWAALGVPLCVQMAQSSAQRPHHTLAAHASVGLWRGAPLVPVSSSVDAPVAVTAAVTGTAPLTVANGPNNSASVWRTFVVRLPVLKKGFTVTAHVDDHIRDVMKMVEESAGIAASRQVWRLNGESVLDPAITIGSTSLSLPSVLRHSANGSTSKSPDEVLVYETEETAVVTVLYKTKNRKWVEKMPVTDKVLKLRAAVQRKTLIPLSRCVLRIQRHGGLPIVMQDRHPISHYKLQMGDIVEVSQE